MAPKRGFPPYPLTLSTGRNSRGYVLRDIGCCRARQSGASDLAHPCRPSLWTVPLAVRGVFRLAPSLPCQHWPRVDVDAMNAERT